MLTVACLLVIVLASGLRRSAAAGRQDTITAACFLGFGIHGHWCMRLVMVLRPVTLDPAFLSFDRSLGFPTLDFYRWFSAHPQLKAILHMVYDALAAVIAAAWLIEQDRTMRRAFLIGGALCFAGYVLFPAVGPAHYDWLTHSAGQFPPNCLPSMHFGWALLLALNARARWLRNGLWIYAALIAVATVAVGEHYLIDLIAAVPYVCGVQWLALRVHKHTLNPIVMRPRSVALREMAA